MQAPIVQTSNKAKRMQVAHQIAKLYQFVFGMPQKEAFAIGLQKAPRREEAERGNDYNLFEITLGGRQVLYHLVREGISGIFYQMHDIEADETIFLLKKAVKRPRLVKMGEIVNLTRLYPYVETLVYGATAEEYDRQHKNRQEFYTK